MLVDHSLSLTATSHMISGIRQAADHLLGQVRPLRRHRLYVRRFPSVAAVYYGIITGESFRSFEDY